MKNIFNKRVFIYTAILLTVFYYFTAFTTYKTDKITMEKEGHKIVLLGMVHQAPNSFYKEITKSVKNYKNNGYKYYYEGVLGTQEEVEQLNKIMGNIDNAERKNANFYGFEEQDAHNELKKGIRADITIKKLVKDLKEEKVLLTTEMKAEKKESKPSNFQISLHKAWLRFCYRFNDFVGFKEEGLYKVLIEKRNDKLIQTIDFNNNAVITYGQLHIDDIVKKLELKGYKIKEEQKIEVF